MSLRANNRRDRLNGKLDGKATRNFDTQGNIVWDSGSTVPIDGTVGYAKWGQFIQTDASTPGDGIYVNSGTALASAFVPISSLALGSFFSVAVPILASDVDKFVWRAPVACTFQGASLVYATAAGVAATLGIRKITADAQAPGAAAGASVVELITAASGNLNTTVNVMQILSPIVSSVAAGNRIAFDFSAPGAMGALAGCVVTLNFTTA